MSKISLGAVPFPETTAEPEAPRSHNPIVGRSITFGNESTADGLCMQTDSRFAHELCSGAAVYEIAQTPVVRAIPQNGDGSKAAQVIGIRYAANTPWTATGIDRRSQQVYATKMEWTAFPSEASDPGSVPAGTADHTLGPTTIDVSLVDGFNVGAELAPDRDTVCAVSEFERGPLVFKLFPAGMPMGDFPTGLTTPEDDICPTDFAVKVGTLQTGCYSQCSWANATGQSQDVIDQNCCAGRFDTFDTCEGVIKDLYIKKVTDNSEGVYTWAYDDYRGTFTCDGTASFTFNVTDVFDARRRGL